MARHSKNATSAPFYSYHERKKIRALGVGTLKGRLDTRACRRFESCWLCLSPARNPLATPQGLIFCKECLFLNFESQKKKIQKETKAWEALQAQKEQEAAAAAEANATAAQRAFLEAEASLTLETSAAPAQTKNSPQSAEEFRQTLEQPTINSKEEARAKNFWVPENTPDEPEAKLKEPQKGFCCPITGAPLRIKQLITVKPVLASKEDTENTRWLCALSGREISHQKAAVVKSTGQVILLEYLEKLVFGKKGALTSGVIDRKDTVALIPGGTGFSAHNNVEVAVARPNVQ
ncbi:hypothetical protein, conserved [Eimeria tenella]|uniref:Nitric oxide synthase-interacting protein zinc-finger domain-containing protein n=1 Tax=Eimeria tenella TaxID=5802 RepID=U6KSZ6_EIMTE|nr:hypothetical protein, conserved [Eimeria tenella]CDJ41247.1 hypothetical protein, conserved [Eimeria tenella]|eukprot:XP_013231997.1 hypothetical protein, conserved [Eimeria tenella]